MRIKLKLHEVTSSFNFTMAENTMSVGLKLNNIFIPEIYKGEYTVVPTFDAQTLQTKSKTMRDDVTVESIPFSEVTNPQDGITLTIGA